MRFKKIINILFTCILCLSLTGCKNSPQQDELEAFANSMVNFSNEIISANEDLNSIDIENVNATDDFLKILDNLEETFKQLADTPIPDHYKGIDELADEAYSNMTNAVSFYHSAYGSENYNPDDADVAYQYYTRAMTRVEYIGYVLTGNIPENENINVHVESDDSQIVNKILQK